MPDPKRGRSRAPHRQQRPEKVLVTLGVKRHLLLPTIRMLLDDPGREPPIAVVDRPPRRAVLLELGVQSGLQGCRVDHSGGMKPGQDYQKATREPPIGSPPKDPAASGRDLLFQ